MDFFISTVVATKNLIISVPYFSIEENKKDSWGIYCIIYNLFTLSFKLTTFLFLSYSYN